MPNDAMILAIDQIRFTWPDPKKMRVYAVGIAADNRGKIMVTEPPSVTSIQHRPKAGRPSTWDFGGDGYFIYQRTGGLPDIVIAHLLVVRDRSAARKAGEIIQQVAGSTETRSLLEKASAGLSKLGPTGIATNTALGLVTPIVEIIGGLIAKKEDKVLQTIQGSMFLDADRKARREFSQVITSPDGNMEVEADVFLFDAASDEDTTADTNAAETSVKAAGLLFTEEGK